MRRKGKRFYLSAAERDLLDVIRQRQSGFGVKLSERQALTLAISSLANPIVRGSSSSPGNPGG